MVKISIAKERLIFFCDVWLNHFSLVFLTGDVKTGILPFFMVLVKY